MAIESYKGIKVPTVASDSVNSGTTTVGGILIDNDKNLADRVTAIESRNITNWKFGVAEPDATLNPHEGDGYFRSTGMAYVYTNGAWSEFANLKGPSGSAVAPTVDTSAAVGGTTVTFTVGESSKSITVPNGQNGSDGRDGTKIFTGTVVTGTTTSISAAVTDSAANDLYINSSTGNLYIASAADTWNYLFTIKGIAGSAGTQIFTGTAVTGTDGTISGDVTGSSAGDFYVNSSTGNFYKAVDANSWNYMFCIKGSPGQDGDDGDDGRDGTRIFTGTIVTGTGTDISATVSGSVAGDLYFNKTTCVLYKASAENLWDSLATLKGADGQDGAGSGWTTTGDHAPDSSSTTCTYELTHGAAKYFSNSAITSLTITSGLSNLMDTCSVEFVSGSSTSYTGPTGCHHFGDGCDASYAFTPAASTAYALTFVKYGYGLTCFVKSL